jgi:medium-chain acyl-[acyl-carrier-protein] hydrolase
MASTMNPMNCRSPWVTITAPRPQAHLRLICLPFAGGGTSAYREWPAHLPDEVEVVAAALPGREGRIGEPALDSVDALAAGLVDGLSRHLDRPFALFGHSMGALVAFEVIRRLRPVGLEPVHFFASGHKAAHVRTKRTPDLHCLPDDEFVAAVGRLNGIPTEILENAEFMEMILPSLRTDFRAAETYDFRPGAPLRCPISAYGGLDDDEVIHEEIEAWGRHTSGPFRVQMFPGDHFFVESSRRSVLDAIRAALDGCTYRKENRRPRPTSPPSRGLNRA